MAYGTRKLVVYGIIGILAAVVLTSSLGIIPNLFKTANARTGTLSVKVTDAPVPNLAHLNLTVSSFEVLNKTGTWIPIPLVGTRYFDLLKLSNVTKDLAIGSLPVGNYTKIRLKIETANATLSDGTTIDLNVPSGHIDLQVNFEIRGGKTTSLIVDIVVDKIQIAERAHLGNPPNLNPQFKFVVVPPS